jgi:hypothetical protein
MVQGVGYEVWGRFLQHSSDQVSLNKYLQLHYQLNE